MLTRHLTTELLEITLDRSRALSVELAKFAQLQYPQTGPKRLIELSISINSRIAEDLSNRLSQKSLLPQTPDRKVEIFLRSRTNLLSLLHSLLQCLEGADIQNSPGTFVVPIRSMLERQLGRRVGKDFDFIVKSSSAYNYMIWTIHADLRRVLLEAGYARERSQVPKLFFIIECPISERRNIPIHCIFAHEIGHVWYQTSSIRNALLTSAMGPRDTIETKLVKASWVEELTADAIALCLLGPAYFYAFTYFAGPFGSMSHASDTHPPDDMRIGLLCQMLLKKDSMGGLAFKHALQPSDLAYIGQWQTYAHGSASSRSASPPYGRIVRSLKPTIGLIMTESKNLTRLKRYSPIRYRRDVPMLCDNIANGIPPNEVVVDFVKGESRPSVPESILNAGWSYLISGDLQYGTLLAVQDTWRITNRLFDLVSKGLEYAEMQRRWSQT